LFDNFYFRLANIEFHIREISGYHGGKYKDDSLVGWDTTPCSFVEGNGRFRGAYFSPEGCHLQFIMWFGR
jgi:hypothetical protein